MSAAQSAPPASLFGYPAPTAHAGSRTLPKGELLVTMACLHSAHHYFHRVVESVHAEHSELRRQVQIDYSTRTPNEQFGTEIFAHVAPLDLPALEEREQTSTLAITRERAFGVHLFPVLTPRKGSLVSGLAVRDRDGTPLRLLSHEQHLHVASEMIELRVLQLLARTTWEPPLRAAARSILRQLRQVPVLSQTDALKLLGRYFPNGRLDLAAAYDDTSPEYRECQRLLYERREELEELLSLTERLFELCSLLSSHYLILAEVPTRVVNTLTIYRTAHTHVGNGTAHIKSALGQRPFHFLVASSFPDRTNSYAFSIAAPDSMYVSRLEVYKTETPMLSTVNPRRRLAGTEKLRFDVSSERTTGNSRRIRRMKGTVSPPGDSARILVGGLGTSSVEAFVERVRLARQPEQQLAFRTRFSEIPPGTTGPCTAITVLATLVLSVLALAYDALRRTSLRGGFLQVDFPALVSLLPTLGILLARPSFSEDDLVRSPLLNRMVLLVVGLSSVWIALLFALGMPLAGMRMAVVAVDLPLIGSVTWRAYSIADVFEVGRYAVLVALWTASVWMLYRYVKAVVRHVRLSKY